MQKKLQMFNKNPVAGRARQLPLSEDPRPRFQLAGEFLLLEQDPTFAQASDPGPLLAECLGPGTGSVRPLFCFYFHILRCVYLSFLVGVFSKLHQSHIFFFVDG